VGISVDFLSLIERGVNAPSFETIEQIAKKLRVPVKALFDFPELDVSPACRGTTSARGIAALGSGRPPARGPDRSYNS